MKLSSRNELSVSIILLFPLEFVFVLFLKIISTRLLRFFICMRIETTVSFSSLNTFYFFIIAALKSLTSIYNIGPNQNHYLLISFLHERVMLSCFFWVFFGIASNFLLKTEYHRFCCINKNKNILIFF